MNILSNIKAKLETRKNRENFKEVNTLLRGEIADLETRLNKMTIKVTERETSLEKIRRIVV